MSDDNKEKLRDEGQGFHNKNFDFGKVVKDFLDENPDYDVFSEYPKEERIRIESLRKEIRDSNDLPSQHLSELDLTENAKKQDLKLNK